MYVQAPYILLPFTSPSSFHFFHEIRRKTRNFSPDFLLAGFCKHTHSVERWKTCCWGEAGRKKQRIYILRQRSSFERRKDRRELGDVRCCRSRNRSRCTRLFYFLLHSLVWIRNFFFLLLFVNIETHSRDELEQAAEVRSIAKELYARGEKRSLKETEKSHWSTKQAKKATNFNNRHNENTFNDAVKVSRKVSLSAQDGATGKARKSQLRAAVGGVLSVVYRHHVCIIEERPFNTISCVWHWSGRSWPPTTSF